ADRLGRTDRRALRPRQRRQRGAAVAARQHLHLSVEQHHEASRRTPGRQMKPITRYFRLLPAVFVVGAGLLALKGVDIARAAQAPAQASDEPDNSGLAPTDAGGATPPRDFASDD